MIKDHHAYHYHVEERESRTITSYLLAEILNCLWETTRLKILMILHKYLHASCVKFLFSSSSPRIMDQSSDVYWFWPFYISSNKKYKNKLPFCFCHRLFCCFNGIRFKVKHDEAIHQNLLKKINQICDYASCYRVRFVC